MLWIANLIVALAPTTRLFGLKRRLLNFSGLRIGKAVRVAGGTKFLNANVYLDDGIWIGPECMFATTAQAEIRVGKDCSLGPRVSLIVGSHQIGSPRKRSGPGLSLPISIGDGTWIGTNATVLGGVQIGSGCIVAAGSVVTQSFPNNVLIAGVPGRIVKSLTDL